MDISVFGLGYVGVVTAALLARRGHRVVGVDTNPLKVESLNSGASPIIEPELPEIVSDAVAAGRLSATQDAVQAVRSTGLSFVAVGTPSLPNGNLDLRAVRTVSRDIAAGLREKKDEEHIVVLRSTVLPGTTESVVLPVLEESGKRAGADLALCFNPEFLREGSSVRDYYHPPFTIIGAEDGRAAGVVAKLYEGIDAPLIRVGIRVAEMVKYACNAFHALKVTFANEIGRLCRAEGIDSHEVMRILCQDTKLNISSAYLRPGFAFGGSCLPKDLRAMLYRAKERDVELPVLSHVLHSNELQVELALGMVTAFGRKPVALLGLSFKEGTDDVRESPMVNLAERLIGKGYEISIYDENVNLSRLIGANRQYLERHIPHIMSLLCGSVEEAVSRADVLVVADKTPRVAAVAKNPPPGKAVVDLVRAIEGAASSPLYHGIAW